MNQEIQANRFLIPPSRFSLRVPRLWLISLFWVVMLAVFHIVGSPFEYEEANSGRYLLPVLQDIDSTLFQNDSYVEALRRFRSGFYDLLSLAFRAVDLAPEHVESAMYLLYIISRGFLVVALFLFARALTGDTWTFLAFALWAMHEKASPVGGESLFRPALIHTSVAFILGIVALSFQLRRHSILFWFTLGLAVLVHSLVALHLAVIAASSELLRPRSLKRSNILGFALFCGFALIYLVFMAPPSLTDEEAHIFLEAKGTINHISPLNQSPLGWLEMASWVVLSALVCVHLMHSDTRIRLIVTYVVVGSAVAFVLASLAITTNSVELARLQPMRIFVWITFLANAVLVAGAVKAVRDGSVLAVPLLGILVFSALGSVVRFLFIALSILCLIAVRLSYFRAGLNSVELNHLVWGTLLIATVGMFAVSFMGWGPIESLRKTSHLIPMTILLITALPGRIYIGRNRLVSTTLLSRSFMLIIVVVICLVISSIQTYQGHDGRSDTDWETVQRWAASNTAKTDRFLSTTEENFRILSQRSAVGSASSAIVWVDPVGFLREVEIQERIRQGFDGSAWSLTYLQDLSLRWELDYLLVEGPYMPSTVAPIFRSGEYAIFRVSGND